MVVNSPFASEGTDVAPTTTVRSALDLPELANGHPTVGAGHAGLDRPVRWAHVTELPDIADLLTGGELILTTGLGLTGEEGQARRFVEGLARANVAGLILELGRNFSVLPDELLEAGDKADLPIVALNREVKFVEVTEAIHQRMLQAVLGDLITRHEADVVFNELTLEGAPPDVIVQAAGDLLDRLVVFENLTHQVMALPTAKTESLEHLANWESRSRLVTTGSENGPAEIDGWLVAPVGARGQRWGRLIIPEEPPYSAADGAVLARAAVALAMGRLVHGQEESIERQSHGSFLRALMSHNYSSIGQLTVRAEALGLPVHGRHLVGVAVHVAASPNGRQGTSQHSGDNVHAGVVANALREADLPGLTAESEDGTVIVLASYPEDAGREGLLSEMAQHVHREFARSAAVRTATVGVGSTVTHLREGRRSLSEAIEVAEAASSTDGHKLYYELPDVRIRGLLYLLRQDVRLQNFIERELGALLKHDEDNRTDLLTALEVYLQCRGNKSAAAEALQLSRPALYHRLSRLSEILETDLESAEVCASLHVALLALQALRHDEPVHGAGDSGLRLT